MLSPKGLSHFYNSNQLGTGQSQNRDTIRYATSGGIRSLSIDAKKSDPLLCDDPLEDFEVEVQANPLPISREKISQGTTYPDSRPGPTI